MEDKENENPQVEEKEQEKEASGISRREFLRDAGLVVGGVTAGALAACAPSAAPTAPTPPAAPPQAPVAPGTQPAPGAVTPASEPVKSVIRGTSFMNFGRNNNPVRVDTRAGKILRVRPMHLEEEGFAKDYLKPYKIEVEGEVLELPTLSTAGAGAYSYKKRVYSNNRILYPLKRVDWEPGGDLAKINPQNRGKSKYKRITWDEATTIIASEIKRIHDKYGLFAVFAQGDGHGEGKVVHGPHGCQTQLLRLMGPDIQSSYTVQIRTPDSWEGYYWGAKHMWGSETVGTSAPATNWKIMDYVKDIEMVVWAKDDENTTGTSSGHDVSRRHLWWMRLSKKMGKENILISPHYNFNAAAYQIKKWFPVLPCQDGALHLAMQYIWLTEGTYDKKYLDTHSVGFDKYADYVLGKEDGVPKTPEWAAPRCGVKEWHIKALARMIAKKKTTFSGTFGTMMRGPYSTEVIRQYIASMAMQGLGAPGRTMGGPVTGLPSVRTDSVSFDRGRNPDLAARGLEENEIAKDDFRTHQFIPKTLVSYAILNPPITWYGTCSPKWVADDQFRKFTYPIDASKGGTRIRMIWSDSPCRTACWQGGFHTMQAYQDPSIEFVLTEHPWLENDTLLSDIILPTTTGFEEYDISAATAAEGYQLVFIQEKGVDPVGESKTDYEVSLEIAKKLEKFGGRYADMVKKYTWGNSNIEDWFKVGYKVQELDKKTGMTYDQFKAKKLWVSPGLGYTEKDLSRQSGVTGFYEDPVKNKLQTPTGLIEFESTALKKNLPNDRERPPVPHWIAGGPGWTWEETPETARGKKYPLLVEGACPRWRHHSQRDDVTWLREIPTMKIKGPDGYLYEPVWISPTDAAARGIVHGDVVSVFNERGTILCGAFVTNRVPPGGLVIHHGSRVDPISTKPGEMIDRGGETNLICGDNVLSQNCGGQVGSGYLVQVEKTNLDALRAKYPEAFAREYDASGVTFNAWVAGGT